MPLTPHRLLRYVVALLCLGVTSAAGAAGTEGVGVLLAEHSPAHDAVGEALRAAIAPGAGDIPVVTDLAALDRAPTRLLVTVGSDAFLAAVKADVKAPILATLLPRAAFERIAEIAARRGAKNYTALLLDQPVGRQLDLIRIALPSTTRVGVLLGPESSALSAALQAAAAERDMRVDISRAASSDEIFPALQRLFENSTVLLAEPDPTVYNGATIQNILLSTYRAQIPLVGFSPAYAKAGALVALFSTPAQIGSQAGEMARAILAGKPLPPPQTPREFSVACNDHVARSLGLHIDDADELQQKLRRLEKQP
jgi:putative ABC transport system substrate-binding protein